MHLWGCCWGGLTTVISEDHRRVRGLQKHPYWFGFCTLGAYALAIYWCLFFYLKLRVKVVKEESPMALNR